MADFVDVFDRASATYDRVGVDFFSVFGQRLCNAAALRAGESVLDIGTGRGAVLVPAAEAVGTGGRVVGIDLAPGMVALTRADCVREGLTQCDVVLGDAADPPLDGQTFDAVLSSQVLFFLDDPAAVLGRWAAHVAPGGRLGLATFVVDPDDDRLVDIIARYVPDVDEEVAPAGNSEEDSFALVRDVAWLDAALAAAGLADIDVDTIRHPTVFTDAQHVIRWASSHGMRSAIEQIPESDMVRFTHEIAEALDANRLPDGRLGFHVSVRFTIARR